MKWYRLPVIFHIATYFLQLLRSDYKRSLEVPRYCMLLQDLACSIAGTAYAVSSATIVALRNQWNRWVNQYQLQLRGKRMHSFLPLVPFPS